MTQKKEDTGSLTIDNRKPNTGGRARPWVALLVPAAFITGMAGMAWIWSSNAGRQQSPPPEPPQQQALPPLDQSGFTPASQVASPATAMPPKIEEALKELEAAKKKLEEDRGANGTGRAGAGQGSQKPRERVRVVSSLKIERPAESAPGGLQNASLDGQAGGEGRGQDREARKGAIYSKNRLEDPYTCQASAGTTIDLALIEAFNTEQGGIITARVTKDSWSRDKSCLTFPVDTIFHGQYKTEVTRGEERVSVGFYAAERPPPLGDTIMLDAAKAYERDGRAGLIGEVKSNIPWGLIFFSTVIDLGAAWLSSVGEGDQVNIGGTIAGNASSVLNEVAKDRYDKAPATIDVARHGIRVKLDKHLPMKPFPIN